MNKQKLIEKVIDPVSIEQHDLEELKKLTHKHSYAAVFSMLYLSGLSQNGDFAFEEELTNHAFKIPSRIQLYELTEGLKTKPEAVEEKNKEEILSEKDIHKTDKIDNTEKEIELSGNETQEKTQEKSSRDILDIDILASAVSKTIENEIDEELSFELNTQEKITPAKEIKEATAIEPSTPNTFMEWLKQQQKSNKEEHKTNLVSEEQKEIKKSAEKETKKKIEKIVEKFIQEEPQISRPKKEFFNPSKVARKSLDESALPISETLAKIFDAQGNYPKAILSYEQLMLKFPEKKSFFANQIKIIKKKINTK